MIFIETKEKPCVGLYMCVCIDRDAERRWRGIGLSENDGVLTGQILLTQKMGGYVRRAFKLRFISQKVVSSVSSAPIVFLEITIFDPEVGVFCNVEYDVWEFAKLAVKLWSRVRVEFKVKCCRS
jgi:hypothetical protein